MVPDQSISTATSAPTLTPTSRATRPPSNECKVNEWQCKTPDTVNGY